MEHKYKYLKNIFIIADICCLILSILFCVQIMEGGEQLQAEARRTETKITVENQLLSDNLVQVSASLQEFINEYEQIQQEIAAVKKQYDELEVSYKKGIYLDSIAAELDHEIGSKAYISRYFQVQKEELQSILDASNLSAGLDAVFPGAEAWGELLPVGIRYGFNTVWTVFQMTFRKEWSYRIRRFLSDIERSDPGCICLISKKNIRIRRWNGIHQRGKTFGILDMKMMCIPIIILRFLNTETQL